VPAYEEWCCSEDRSAVRGTVDQVQSIPRNVLLALVEGEQEGALLLVLNVAFLDCVPPKVTETTDGLAELSFDKCEGVFNVVALRVEGRSFEAVFGSPKQQLELHRPIEAFPQQLNKLFSVPVLLSDDQRVEVNGWLSYNELL
jgi:hypothetical protein